MTGEDSQEETVTCRGSAPATCLQVPFIRLHSYKMVASGKKAFEFCSVSLLLPSEYLFKWLQYAERCLHVFKAEDTDDCTQGGPRKDDVISVPKPTQAGHTVGS